MTPYKTRLHLRRGILPPQLPHVSSDQSLVEYINQNGIAPGPVKLVQFQAALQLRSTPPLLSQEGTGNEAIAYVKLFDPCGGATWYLTEWDREEEAFGYVTGLGCDEWGSIPLGELAQVPGRFGIGIEIDVWFIPAPLKTVLRHD
jgi:hypothetical protein